MICAHCGTSLPSDALFCGECGRLLAKQKSAPAVVVEAPVLAVAEGKAPEVKVPEEKVPEVKVPEEKVPTAPSKRKQSKPARAAELPSVDPAPASPPKGSDTTIIDLLDEPAIENREPLPSPISIEEITTPPILAWTPPRRLLSGAVDLAEPTEDLEETRLVNTQGGLRFVLQFSTGESVTAFGTGLIGRNPVAEPSEYFDQLIAIVDPGKSVSKTHLEFGQIAGAFWVADRYSGNGTVVREPESQPRRCEPGKRYRVARGTRVSIGEQFFVIS